ncbi:MULTISPECIES: DUF257 family protein [Pyrococcus]|uniref:DUF257 family protein n=1 Tax=Pyrococcus TaxID=2260 RepID=UPI00258980C6|nr:DUF257 family protein [Pyrococcus sp.]MDK2870345.1 hypothetical protein [Pyrococcus sp.]
MTFQLLNDFIKDKLFGETVLLENYSYLGVESLLSIIIKVGEELNVPILVEDVLDTFSVYTKHLEMLGIATPELKILKIGGSGEEEGIVKRIPFELDIPRYLLEYGKAFEEVAPREKFIDLVFGLDRLFLLTENPTDIAKLLNSIKDFVRNENRTAFYFIEANLLKVTKPIVLHHLEDIATSVVRINQEKNILTFELVKDKWSVKNKISKITISFRDILRGIL